MSINKDTPHALEAYVFDFRLVGCCMRSMWVATYTVLKSMRIEFDWLQMFQCCLRKFVLVHTMDARCRDVIDALDLGPFPLQLCRYGLSPASSVVPVGAHHFAPHLVAVSNTPAVGHCSYACMYDVRPPTFLLNERLQGVFAAMSQPLASSRPHHYNSRHVLGSAWKLTTRTPPVMLGTEEAPSSSAPETGTLPWPMDAKAL